MCNTILMTLLAFFFTVSASAQFHTVTKGEETDPVFTMEPPVLAKKQPEKALEDDKTATLASEKEEMKKEIPAREKNSVRRANALKSNVSKYPKSKKEPSKPQKQGELPDLTIANLYEEIQRHGILFPKIVLAQAILETGWFRSHACRKKNNLFGLTNPRTGKYFEFGHWTDSVRAYYTKVQYRYTGGNYLLWLKKIGYAEDKGYIQAVIKILRML